MHRASVLILLASVLAVAVSAPAQTIRPGRWDRKDQIPDGWVVYNTKHYQVQCQSGKEKAKRLGKHMEAMWKVYFKTFRPDRNWDKRQPVKLFSNRRVYLAYGAPPSAAAYYHRIKREMVCYDTGKWMDEEAADFDPNDPAAVANLMKMDLLGVAAHEGWHQYFHWYVTSMISLPSWVNEGMGDYFYCARPIKVNGRTKAEVGRPNRVRLPVIRAAVKAGKHVPFEQILYWGQSDYYANPSVCYSQGWSMCQFMLHHDNKRIRKIVPTFVKLMRDNSLVKKNMDKALKGIDIAELQKEWEEWVAGLRLPEEVAMAREAMRRKNKGRKNGDRPATSSGAEEKAGEKKGDEKKRGKSGVR